MAMSVDGLVSGLSTSDLINQLMQVEALPQTALKNKVSAQNKALTAYQGINTKLAALTTAAKALDSDSAWNAVKATSSSDAAIVTTTATATPGSITFKVDNVATAHTVLMSGRVTSPTDVNQPVISDTATFVFNAQGTDGSPVPLTAASASLKAVVDAINNSPVPLAYRAAIVQPTAGQYTIQLSATKAGADPASAIDPALVPDSLGAATDMWPGQDAAVTILGPDANNDGNLDPLYTLTSTTNAFTGVLPGVNISVTKPGTVTINTTVDPDTTVGKVQALVDAANTALKEIKTATAAKNGSTAAGPLAGDSALRALSQQIISAVATGAGSLGSLATVGITVERDGTLAFDKKTFQSAFDADPTGTRAYFVDPLDVDTERLATRLEDIGHSASATTGTVTTLIKRRSESIAALNDQVEVWDVRLASRRAALQRQYSALEVALGKLKDQQSWLSGQLAGLS
jgi:flagellar hook-associated protein 2